MNHTSYVKRTNPESAMQERFSVVAWVIFHTIALWSSAVRWLKWKRVCKWHQPSPIRMGGNPFARKTTHGMCRECFEKQEREILSHAV